eukprot:symbB.v1.2.000029.t1/scaffold12.1/size699752/9
MSSDAALAARDFFGGTLGGMTGILAGHPLDTTKTRLQAMPRFDHSNAYRVLVDTARVEGSKALYKGLSFPFCSTALLNAVVFGVQGTAERALKGLWSDDRPQLTGFVAGCIAGLAQSPLVCAVDLIKTQRQVQLGWHGDKPLEIARNRMKLLGLRGFFQGLGPTAVKECPSYGVYFLVYEESKSLLDPHLPSVASTLWAGGLAGCFALGMIHPVDVVKSRVQALPATASLQERSPRHVMALGLRNEGLAFFLRGFQAAMARAFVVNAATFSGGCCLQECRNYVALSELRKDFSQLWKSVWGRKAPAEDMEMAKGHFQNFLQAVKESTAYWPGLDMEKVERHLAELKESEANEASTLRSSTLRCFRPSLHEDASLQRIRERLSGLATDAMPTPPRVVLDSWQDGGKMKILG